MLRQLYLVACLALVQIASAESEAVEKSEEKDGKQTWVEKFHEQCSLDFYLAGEKQARRKAACKGSKEKRKSQECADFKAWRKSCRGKKRKTNEECQPTEEFMENFDTDNCGYWQNGKWHPYWKPRAQAQNEWIEWKKNAYGEDWEKN